MSEEDTILRALRHWHDHPAAFVRQVLRAEPDVWQEEVLEAFPRDPRIVMTACKGPGKSTVLAWLVLNFLMTRPQCKVGVLGATATALADTLWAEIGYWMSKSEILQKALTMTTARIERKDDPANAWASAKSFARTANSQEQSVALQGFHFPHCLLVMDEAGGLTRNILATAEAVLSGGLDQHLVMAGNPTNQDSALGEAVLNQRAQWRVFEITGDPEDPKRASRVELQWARDQIAAWGKDNPWVLVNVYGRFPPSGLNTLLSPDEVRDAQKRHYIESVYSGFPKIIGVDVARYGDDEIVFFKRQGKVAFPPLRMRNLDTVFVGSHLSRISNEWKADSIQIDATGSAGVYDVMKSLGHSEALPVQFGGKAKDDRKFVNMRAEMYWELAQEIKSGLALPPVPEMVKGLSSMTYTYDRMGRLQLEEKDQIKAKILRSPDLEDALACTYAFPVAVQTLTISGLPQELSSLIGGRLHQNGLEYDPYAQFAKEQERQHG